KTVTFIADRPRLLINATSAVKLVIFTLYSDVPCLTQRCATYLRRNSLRPLSLGNVNPMPTLVISHLCRLPPTPRQKLLVLELIHLHTQGTAALEHLGLAIGTEAPG